MTTTTPAVPTGTDYIDDVFGPTGYLAQRFDGYRPRPGQIALARTVEQGISNHEHVLAEGPTGTGKSIAYAVPASYHAATHGTRVVIATANIALQEQLVRKDLPLLQQILPWKFTYAILKGRNNYLCLDKYRGGEAQATLAGFSKTANDDDLAGQVADWARRTETGDVSELPFEPPARIWRRFSVAADECKGSKKCQFADECHGIRAREAAGVADIVVTNYHLLFAHIALRHATGVDMILPPFSVAILDEGHKAADIARDFFGFRVSQGGIAAIQRAVGKRGYGKIANDLAYESGNFFDGLLFMRESKEYKARIKKTDSLDWRGLETALLLAADILDPQTREPGDDAPPERDTFEDEVGAKDAFVRSGAPPVPEDEVDRETRESKKLGRSARKSALNIRAAMQLTDDNTVYFIDTQLGDDQRKRAILSSKPIDISRIISGALFDMSQSVVVTSATLATGDRDPFAYIDGELGVGRARKLIAETPFNYNDQALLILPEEMPDPTTPGFTDAVALAFERTIIMAGGRTLGLFTSYRSMNAVYDRVKNSGYRILKQGDRPRTALIDEFRRDVGSVLLGTESFWAGVDVPGESLSVVFIDKLPFPSPDDPVLDAISARDEKWFFHYSIPRAVIAFKQGFGRLIRTSTDRGVVVLCDNRVLTKGYGKTFIKALPDVMKSRKLENIEKFLGKPVAAEEEVPF